MTPHDNFKRALELINQGRQTPTSIGLLQEKSLHATIKHMIDPDSENHEILIDSLIADVFVNNTVYEIQTRHFDKLRPKIIKFTKEHSLHIIYPIAYKKVIRWYNTNHSFVKQNKSPKTGRIYDVLLELYKIRPYLNNPNLFIDLYFFHIEELRCLDGWDTTKKKGATKIDRLPVLLETIISLNNPQDYLKFLPETLVYPFTNKELSLSARITLRQATIITILLKELGLIKKVGTLNRFYLYDLV